MSWSRRNVSLVVGLGSAQLIAWGSLYYAIAVLGEPMRLDLGVSSSHVFGAFTWSMVIAGLLAPAAGRTLDRHGGRVVLITSALAGAVGFVVLANARSLAGIIAGWSINGAAMALGLYDACFAAIGQAEPRAYRIVVTGVTLIAGFASTVAWPLTHYLLQAIGWRGVCHVFALALLLCAPLYAVLLRGTDRAGARASQPEQRPASSPSMVSHARILSWAFAGTALIGGSISAHLPSILGTLELHTELAVWIAASIGALQVVGRLFDLALGTRRTVTQLGTATLAGMLAALLLLLAARVAPATVFGFALLYGIANGLLTIVRATLPIELFGLAQVGSVLGSFSAPSLVARAFAPLGFALLAERAGTNVALASLAALGFASLVAYLRLRSAQRWWRRSAA